LISGNEKAPVSIVLGGGTRSVCRLPERQKIHYRALATMTVHPVRMNGLVVAFPRPLPILIDA
jgi:hypothetical protein